MLATPDVTEMQSKFAGKRFGFLLVQQAVKTKVRAVRLQCLCDCGESVLAQAHTLVSGERVSCGCWKKQVLGASTRTHGQANSRITGYKNRTYGIWQAMRDRCSNPRRKDYYRYGGRGISVCKRWEKFENFLADMGEAPPSLTLERKNGDKDYTPHNCQWATRKQQSRNTARNVWYTHKGKTLFLKQWLQETGVTRDTYYKRKKRGMSVGQALGLIA